MRLTDLSQLAVTRAKMEPPLKKGKRKEKKKERKEKKKEKKKKKKKKNRKWLKRPECLPQPSSVGEEVDAYPCSEQE